MGDLNQGLVLRDKNGSPMADGRVDLAFGGLFIDDGTGFVSGATPAAQIVAAAPLTTGRLNSVTHDSGLTTERATATAGKLEIRRSGDYRVEACGDMLSGNSAVAKIEVFKNGAVIADAAGFPGGSIRADLTFAGTAVKMSWALTGLLGDLKAGTDLIDLRVTSNVGTVTIKILRFSIWQISDVNAPVFV